MTLAAALLLAAAGAAAQTMSFEEAAAEAAARHPDLAASREALARSRWQYRGSFAPFLPQVTGTAGVDRSGTHSTAETSSSLGLNVRQSLFSGLRDYGQTARVRADLEGSHAALAGEEASVRSALKRSFYSLLFAQESLGLSRSIESRRRENLRLVELRFEAGREHRGSYLRSRAAHSQARFELSQSERSLRSSQRSFASALGRAEIDVLAAAGTFRAEAAAPPDFRALATRTPAYRAAAARAAAAEAGVTVARSRWFPELAASASTGRSGSEWPPRRDRWAAGLSLSIPLFSGGADYFDVKAARAQLRGTRAELRASELEVLTALENAWASLADAVGRAEVQREFLEAAELRAQIARGQYTSGLLSFENWDIIENDLIGTQRARLASLRDAVLAEAEWERALGRGFTP